MDFIYNIAIIVFSFIGIYASYLLIETRKNIAKGEKVSCGKSCSSVIQSRFSHFFGLDVEKLGFFYYSFIAILFLVNLVYPIPSSIFFWILVLTLIAFIYNLHLVFTQLVVLKKWCTICLWSSAASFMILILSFLGYHYSFGYELFEMRDIFSWVYILSIMLGVIISTRYAVLFMRFIRDFKITESEDRRLSMYSHSAWLAITLSLLSGLGLVLTDTYFEVMGASRFWVLVILIFLLLSYEIVLNYYIIPELMEIHFGEREVYDNHRHPYLRKTAYTFTIVGLITWYYTLLLSIFPFYKASSYALLAAYIIFVIAGVVVALWLERMHYKESLFLREKNEKEKENSTQK